MPIDINLANRVHDIAHQLTMQPIRSGSIKVRKPHPHAYMIGAEERMTIKKVTIEIEFYDSSVTDWLDGMFGQGAKK